MEGKNTEDKWAGGRTICMAVSMNDTPKCDCPRSTLSPERNVTPLPVSADFTRLLRLDRNKTLVFDWETSGSAWRKFPVTEAFLPGQFGHGRDERTGTFVVEEHADRQRPRDEDDDGGQEDGHG